MTTSSTVPDQAVREVLERDVEEAELVVGVHEVRQPVGIQADPAEDALVAPLTRRTG